MTENARVILKYACMFDIEQVGMVTHCKKLNTCIMNPVQEKRELEALVKRLGRSRVLEITP